MIKGRKRIELDRKSILDRISEYDIYRFYQGNFKINEVCVNRHRGEKDPSLIIGDKTGNGLTHKDFGDYNWRGDAFNFVEQIFRCDFDKALRFIDRDFGLGLSNGKVIIGKPAVITWETPEIEIKRAPLIQVVYYSKMSPRALDYWSKLCQGEPELKRENIFQVKDVWRNRKKVGKTDLLTYGYYYPDIDRWKIYRPLAPKKDEKTPPSSWKWDSNVPFDYIDNLGSINPSCDRVFMTKSKKDRMVLMTALQTECMADVQAEDPSCLTPQALNKFKEVGRRWIISDNDKKGKEFSWWLTKHHGFLHANVPDKYFKSDPKCTDFADLCYHYGIQTVIDHFKRKKII